MSGRRDRSDGRRLQAPHVVRKVPNRTSGDCARRPCARSARSRMGVCRALALQYWNQLWLLSDAIHESALESQEGGLDVAE